MTQPKNEDKDRTASIEAMRNPTTFNHGDLVRHVASKKEGVIIAHLPESNEYIVSFDFNQTATMYAATLETIPPNKPVGYVNG